ncbi:hypothetical protein ACN6K8_006734 [[Kitasatospora] papulosa]
MAKAIDAGIPKLRIEEAAARTQARIDAGRQAVTRLSASARRPPASPTPRRSRSPTPPPSAASPSPGSLPPPA